MGDNIHRPLVLSFSWISSAATSVGHYAPQIRSMCTGVGARSMKPWSAGAQALESYTHGADPHRASPPSRHLGWPWSAALNNVVPNLTEWRNQLLNPFVMMRCGGVGEEKKEECNHFGANIKCKFKWSKKIQNKEDLRDRWYDLFWSRTSK